jgi:hypothetical protein
MGLSAEAPDLWIDMPEEERKTGCILDTETCVIKDTYFFVKANLELPLRGEEAFFTYTVWVALSREGFERIVDNWQNPLRARAEPYSGYLATRLPGYPETINLRCKVYESELGMRPIVILEPTDHPLAVEQREGMTRDRIRDIISLITE